MAKAVRWEPPETATGVKPARPHSPEPTLSRELCSGSEGDCGVSNSGPPGATE